MANNSNSKKGGNGKPRKLRKHAEQLPVFIANACEFSDDPECLDNAVWVVRAIKRELISGGGPVGNLWQELHERIDAPCGKKEGFTELEAPEIVAPIGEAADALIRNAMKHDPDIGNNVGIDASGFHSRAVLHHCCIEPVACEQAQGLKHIDIATSRTVKESRWDEANEPPEVSLRHKESARVVAIRTGNPKRDDESVLQGYDKVIQISGHWYGLHDSQAAVRSYKQSHGTTKESWIGGYDIIAVDLKYGAKLQGLVAPNDRQECNLYFPLMRKLEQTIQKWPEAVTGDRGQSLKKIFRFNTRRGIASVSPGAPQAP